MCEAEEVWGLIRYPTAYAIPIAARFLGDNDFEPGPFNLGRWSLPVAVISILWMTFMGIVFLFPASPTTDVADMNYTVVRTTTSSHYAFFGKLTVFVRWCSAAC